MSRIAGAVLLVVLVVGAGEVNIAMNRRRRQARSLLERTGRTMQGVVTALDKVSAGKYGQYRWRATISYTVDGRPFTLTEQWWPSETRPDEVGEFVGLLVDPDDPSRAIVAGTRAPGMESDRLWRTIEAALVVGVVVVLLVSW